MTFRSFAGLLAMLLLACGPAPPTRNAAPARSATTAASAPPTAPAPRVANEPEYHSTAQDDAPDRFADAGKWSKVFDDPARDAWQRPDQLIAELGLRPDDLVADLGAGTGYFTIRLAKAVPKGKVYGIDISQGMLDWIQKRAARDGVSNVETILAAPDDPKLPKGVDLILIVDTFHHISDRVAYFHRILPRLERGGRIVIVDYKLGKLPVGPPDSHKIPRPAIEREMTKAGYALCRSWDGLPYQHVLFFAEHC